jgi:CBS-domain-containing membrane protein
VRRFFERTLARMENLLRDNGHCGYVITVSADAGVRDVAKILLTNRISAVPVVDEQGKLVGIMSEGDLVRRPEIGSEKRRSWWLDAFLVYGRNDRLSSGLSAPPAATFLERKLSRQEAIKTI